MNFAMKCPTCGEMLRTFRTFEGDEPNEWICACGTKVLVPKKRPIWLRGPDIAWDGKQWVELTDESGKPYSMGGEIGEPVVLTPHGYKEKTR